MKRIVLITALLIISTAYVLAGDPQSANYTQGTLSLARGGLSSLEYKALAKIHTPTYLEKIAMYSAGLAATEQFVQAGESFYNAEKSATDDSYKTPSVPTAGNVPTTPNTDRVAVTSPFGSAGSRASNGVPSKPILTTLKNISFEKAGQLRKEVQSTEAALQSEGINPQEALANLTAAEQAQMDQIKNKASESMDSDLKDTDKIMEKLLAEAGDEYSSFSNSSFSSRGLGSQGGIFINTPKDFSSLSMDMFFKRQKEGIENSAQGYYGNVSLKSLRPESKKSLFERVSLKLKHLM